MIYSVAGRVYVARSTDLGKTFETAVPLNTVPAEVDDNHDARPVIAVAADGTIAAVWSVWRDNNWNGEVLTSRSTDRGKTFSTPTPISRG